MNTGKQINAMVVVLFLTVITVGAYTLWDPLRSESAEDVQVEKAAERAATTYAVNCRLCHGDRGEGPPNSGRLPQALPLDTDFLRGIESGVRSEDALNAAFKFVTDTINCGRVGTFMPSWGAAQGGTLNDEQVRQLSILITEGRWDLAQAHADEIDAEAAGHATVQMPDGVLGASETELIVSNAAPFSVDQYIRIRNDDGTEERLQIIDIPSTGQQLAEEIGRTASRFLVSGAEGIEVGALIRLDGELMEVTAVRDDGDPNIVLDEEVPASAARIFVSDPAFFRPDYVLRVDDELIQVVEAVSTGQTLGEPVGRAETTITVSGTEGIRTDMVIRIGRELMRVTAIQPARLEVERGAEDTDAASHPSGTAILKGEVGEEEEPDTGESLTEAIDAGDTSFTVTGTMAIAEDEIIVLGDELLRVNKIEPARLRVQRGVEGSDRAAHARRVDIFEDNMLQVRRGVDGTRAAAHDKGGPIFLTTLEVKRAASGSDREDHSKNAEIFLGHRLIVERGVLNTEPADHRNGTLIRDFPPAVEPQVNEEACGDRRVGRAAPATPAGPTATPPPGAQQVAVSLTEFAIAAEPAALADGAIAFQASNDGIIPHNLRVIASDLPAGELPVSGTMVDETQVDVRASIGDPIGFAAGETQSATAELPPGNYVLICNVASHYGAGMWLSFEVTPP